MLVYKYVSAGERTHFTTFDSQICFLFFYALLHEERDRQAEEQLSQAFERETALRSRVVARERGERLQIPKRE